MKKRVLAFLATSIFLFAFIIPIQNVEASYVPITPFYLYAATATSTLTIDSGTATCSSALVGGASVTKITGHQYLQMNNGCWETISNGHWEKTVNDFDLTMINTKPSLPAGTYRLKTIYYVYCGNNYEVIEKISYQVSI
jgi:hypothetical protein